MPVIRPPGETALIALNWTAAAAGGASCWGASTYVEIQAPRREETPLIKGKKGGNRKACRGKELSAKNERRKKLKSLIILDQPAREALGGHCGTFDRLPPITDRFPAAGECGSLSTIGLPVGPL
jgi:hypothetical protein